MAKQKRARIAAVKTFPNVTHNGAELKGQWHKIFNNDFPITLELGCGKGDYTLTLAQQQPQHNFIGVDLKGARLWAASKFALDSQINNVFFILANALDLADIFAPNDISEIWITFPDPYPKKPRKRMTATRYLDVYRQICVPNAPLHLKTDDDALYEFSLQTLGDYGCAIQANVTDVHATDAGDERLKIITFYEQQHLTAGLAIKYIRFSLPTEEKL